MSTIGLGVKLLRKTGNVVPYFVPKKKEEALTSSL